MEVPFIGSGALSRAHYALVRAVEEAHSTSQADQRILDEVDVVREALAKTGSDMAKCRELLLRLLYCTTALTHIPIPSSDLEFAFPYALTLAEAGRTIPEKRTGYLVATQLLPPSHELQLMLVNTIRKDLASNSKERIANVGLALETLIAAPSEDVVPAVQGRLVELVSHTAAPIRRRALLAHRALAAFRPATLTQPSLLDKLPRRLKDSDSSVIIAGLSVIESIVQTDLEMGKRFRNPVNDLLRFSVSSTSTSASSSRVDQDGSKRNSGLHMSKPSLCKTLEVLRVVGVLEENYGLIDAIIRSCAKNGPDGYATLYQAFLLFSPLPRPIPGSSSQAAPAAAVPLETYLRAAPPPPSPSPSSIDDDVVLSESAATSPSSPVATPSAAPARKAHPNPVKHIRSLLLNPSSDAPGRPLLHTYTFLSCLACVDPLYWAGTDPSGTFPPVLESWEVERVMGLLTERDEVVRRKTLEVLGRVDAVLVEGYLHSLLSSSSSAAARSDVGTSTTGSNEVVGMAEPQVLLALEAIDVLHVENGEGWALAVLKLLRAADAGASVRLLMEGVVTHVLRRVEDGNEEFKLAATTTILASAIEETVQAERASSPIPAPSTLSDPSSTITSPPPSQPHSSSNSPPHPTNTNATHTTILAALATQYSAHLTTSPALLLRALARHLPLPSTPPSVQDAVLVAMVRILAGWDWGADGYEYEVGEGEGRTKTNMIDLGVSTSPNSPSSPFSTRPQPAINKPAEAMAEVVRTIKSLADRPASGRGVKRRCELFLGYLARGTEGRAELRGVVERAASPSLPGFAASLEPRSSPTSPRERPSSSLSRPRSRASTPTPNQGGTKSRSTPRSPLASPTSTARSLSPTMKANTKLRYEAYDPPPAVPMVSLHQRLGQTQNRSPSMATSSLGLSLSPVMNTVGTGMGSPGRSPVHRDEIELRERSPGLTAGDLALSIGGPGRLLNFASSPPREGQGQGDASSTEVTPRASKDFGRTVGRLRTRQESAPSDLISLDSPFLAEPSSSRHSKLAAPTPIDSDPDPFSTSPSLLPISSSSESLPDVTFERTWNALALPAITSSTLRKGKGKAGKSADVRGWSSTSVRDLVEIVRGARFDLEGEALGLDMLVVEKEQSPFEGETKLVLLPHATYTLTGSVSSELGVAAIRLRAADADDSAEGEGEGGTFWRVRCALEDLRAQVKQLLEED